MNGTFEKLSTTVVRTEIILRRTLTYLRNQKGFKQVIGTILLGQITKLSKKVKARSLTNYRMGHLKHWRLCGLNKGICLYGDLQIVEKLNGPMTNLMEEKYISGRTPNILSTRILMNK